MSASQNKLQPGHDHKGRKVSVATYEAMVELETILSSSEEKFRKPSIATQHAIQDIERMLQNNNTLLTVHQEENEEEKEEEETQTKKKIRNRKLSPHIMQHIPHPTSSPRPGPVYPDTHDLLNKSKTFLETHSPILKRKDQSSVSSLKQPLGHQKSPKTMKKLTPQSSPKLKVKSNHASPVSSRKNDRSASSTPRNKHKSLNLVPQMVKRKSEEYLLKKNRVHPESDLIEDKHTDKLEQIKPLVKRQSEEYLATHSPQLSRKNDPVGSECSKGVHGTPFEHPAPTGEDQSKSPQNKWQEAFQKLQSHNDIHNQLFAHIDEQTHDDFDYSHQDPDRPTNPHLAVEIVTNNELNNKIEHGHSLHLSDLFKMKRHRNNQVKPDHVPMFSIKDTPDHEKSNSQACKDNTDYEEENIMQCILLTLFTEAAYPENFYKSLLNSDCFKTSLGRLSDTQVELLKKMI